MSLQNTNMHSNPTPDLQEIHEILTSKQAEVKKLGWILGRRYIFLENGEKYQLSLLAKTLSNAFKKISEGHFASTAEYLVEDTKIILDFYQKNSNWFNFFGKNKYRTHLEKEIESITIHKASRTFGSIFRLKSEREKKINEIRKNSYKDSETRQLLDHKKISIADCLNAKKEATSQMNFLIQKDDPKFEANKDDPKKDDIWASLHFPSQEYSQEAIRKFLDSFVDTEAELPQQLSPNVTYKMSGTDTLNNHQIAFCETQGKRTEMEDKHIATSFTVKIGNKEYPFELAGVFDGHQGDLAATYAQQFYAPMLESKLKSCDPNLTTEAVANALIQTNVALHENWCLYCDEKIKELEKAIADIGLISSNSLESGVSSKELLFDSDKVGIEMVEINEINKSKKNEIEALLKKKNKLRAGTTAAAILHINNCWYTSNVGDSRILLVPPGKGAIRQVTLDGTPENQEKEIIEREGILDSDKKKYRAIANGTPCFSGGSIGDCYLGIDTKNFWTINSWTISDQGVNPRGTVQFFFDKEVPEGSDFLIITNEKEKVASSLEMGTFVQKTNLNYIGKASYIAKRCIELGATDNITVGILKVHYSNANKAKSSLLT